MPNFHLLIQAAARLEVAHQYHSAKQAYLIAASNADDANGEEIALTYAWWMHERAYGRVSELERKSPT